MPPVFAQTTTDLELTGTAVSPGIGIGTAYHFTQIDLTTLQERRLPVDNVDAELERIESAHKKSVEQLRVLQAASRDDFADVSDIFQVQIQILSDAGFLSGIRSDVSENKANAEYVIANSIRGLEKKFMAMQTDVFKSKLLDVQDVYHRLLRNILDIEHVRVTPLRNMPAGVVIVAEQLLPSDVALLDLGKIVGIIIETGSTVSHVSIIAKSLGIPALINVPGALSLVRSGTPLIVDGHEGRAIVSPSPATEARYRKKLLAVPQPLVCRPSKTRKCLTKDGIAVRLEANAGSLLEAKEALKAGAEGIGLLRSELFYLSLKKLPTVDEESFYYESIIALCNNKPVTIRLLDTGADKTLPYLAPQREENPYLGVRGVRFLLENPVLLENHLTSILRACARGGNVRILIPFVSLPSEVDAIDQALHRIGKREGVARSRYSLGIMVEVPAAVVSLRSFLDKVDFLSIGTNDLVQYAFAASRENSRLEQYRTGSFRVLLALVKQAMGANEHHRRDVSVCGEVASDPARAPYLVGLGIRALSMHTSAISPVCREIEKKSVHEMEKMARECIERE
ncbi:MAG TPA: phosphoenolpyruvate--protein phosphotransferase [Chitinivibrionales bacterium]|jgi:phosphoenolpyruvate-protein phosphotransferase|nr:phosphoenolpyruvate--protein phosphotransferase [Chitinivibrionales bacterium]